LRKPWRAGRRYDVGRERHRAQDHEREAEAAEGVAIFGPQPSADRDGQQEVSAVDEAARVLEEVPVGELRGCGLQDQRGFITVKQVPVERRWVVRLHSKRGCKVAHDLVSDQHSHERRPPAQQRRKAARPSSDCHPVIGHGHKKLPFLDGFRLREESACAA
jgi:hypothetical protein